MYKYNGGILKLVAHGKNRWQRIYKWVDHTLHTGPTFRSRFTKKTNKYFMSGFGTMFFFTLFLRVNFRTLSTLWVLCRFEREEGEDCCCTKRKHARLSVCAIVLKWEHRCRGTNVELFAYNDYGQLSTRLLKYRSTSTLNLLLFQRYHTVQVMILAKTIPVAAQSWDLSRPSRPAVV